MADTVLPNGEVLKDDPNFPPASGGSGVPSGGSTGEVLTKDSNTDGDVSWQPGSVENVEATPVVLIDDGAGNYLPAELKNDTSRPREFRGPTNPDGASGVIMNSTPYMDTWVIA